MYLFANLRSPQRQYPFLMHDFVSCRVHVSIHGGLSELQKQKARCACLVNRTEQLKKLGILSLPRPV
jgi:hypothetical protein